VDIPGKFILSNMQKKQKNSSHLFQGNGEYFSNESISELNCINRGKGAIAIKSVSDYIKQGTSMF
jgi:hypothetical protein